MRIIVWCCLGGLLFGPCWAEELPPDTAATYRPEFNKRDADSNGTISLVEHLANVPADQQPSVKREFLVMDFDANGELTFSEYLALKRVDIPDSWRESSRSTLETFRKIFKEADANGDGISRQEWPKSEIQKDVMGFATKTYSQWDANQDGLVTDDEVARMVEIGFALTLPSGEPARWPNGKILYWKHLREVDRNRDGIVSRKEFVAKHTLGREQNETLFTELDQNKDDQLTYAEYASTPPFVIDQVAEFFQLDADLDGRLSLDELKKLTDTEKKSARELAIFFSAFDEDGDGKYSLREYQMSPLGGLYHVASLLDCRDSNQDGVISFKELNSRSSPLFYGIVGEVFQRLDRNHDGQLTSEEFGFPEDPELVQYIVQVSPQIREQLASELNFFLAINPVSPEQRALLKSAVHQSFDNVVRQAAIAQKQMQRGFNANNPPPIPDPQMQFAEDLGQFAKAHCSEESSSNYHREIQHRETLRRSATVHNLVSRLDRDLLLSEEQREKISEALLEKWQPQWSQQIEIVMQNDHMMMLPDPCVTPFLRNEQQSVWQSLPKTHYGWNVFRQQGLLEPAEDDPIRDLLPGLDEDLQLGPNVVRPAQLLDLN